MLGRVRLAARAFKNWPLILLDRAGLLRRPYVLSTRTGLEVEVRPRTGDRFTAWETFARNVYFSQRQRLKPGQTVVDVGANIGCFTLLAARLVGPKGRVVAFEPDPNNLTRLQRNIALNQLKNVTVLPNAVGDRTASVDLFGGGSSLFPSLFDKVDDRQDPTLRGKVSMIALADALEMCQIARVDYLKLDCEGAEHLIFSTLSPETARCIDQITMEVHKVPGYENDDLMNRLINLGYSLNRGDLFYFRR